MFEIVRGIAVLGIGIGLFGALMVIALVVVGVVRRTWVGRAVARLIEWAAG